MEGDNQAMSPSACSSKELNHLGLVAAMFDELGVGSVIDDVIHQDVSQRKVTIGQAVKAMVINGLGFANQRLYLVPHFFDGKPVEQLIGPGVHSEDLNDDTLGRALDAIYDIGPTELYRAIASRAMHRMALSGWLAHMDTTTFHTDGRYEHADEEGVIRITRGYSRDHRPELNQFGLHVESEAGIPMMMAPLSGNANDKTVFREAVQNHVRQLQEDHETGFLVADSALYTAETIKRLDGLDWVTRVPETLVPARSLIAGLAGELAAVNDGSALSFSSVCTTYGGIRQQWIVVYSPQARKRAMRSVAKWCERRSEADQRALAQLCKREFACEADAFRAIDALTRKLKISALHGVRVEALPRYNKRGRPADGAVPDAYAYRVHATMASDYDQYIQRLQRKSCFILATNRTEVADAEKIVTTYKGQQTVERGFRFLKDPMFLASSVFLKSPKRIMALTMVMTCCLLVYAALEHRIREKLAEAKRTFPTQTGKTTDRPTVRWVFQCFQNIAVLYINNHKTAVLNLNTTQENLLKILGHSFEQIYS
jgi:transposase